MAAEVPSSDLLLSPVCSSEIAISTEASSSVGCKHRLDKVDAGVASTVGTAERVAMLMQQFVGGIESRVLEAVKQAIAEVIDRLAKEAATRVVMAEHKTAGLEQELIHVKQQALAMLLHSKQTTDFQIAKTESRCVYERRRAQDAEDKLSTLQESVRRLKGQLKKRGGMLESMQKFREQGLRYSYLDIGDDCRNKECKMEQPELDMESLLLFAGVVCEDASKRDSGSMQNLPATASALKSRNSFQALSSLSQAHIKAVSNMTAETFLAALKQPVQQANDLHVAENGKACMSPYEQPPIDNSATGTNGLRESSFQDAEMQTLNGAEDEHMLSSSKIGIRKNGITFRRCVNGSKLSVDQNSNEIDQIHPLGVQSLDARSVFESSGLDPDSVCKSEVNVAEKQANQSNLPIEASSFARGHSHSCFDVNGVVDCCEETLPKCSGELSLVQKDPISSSGKAPCLDESESMEFEQALRCLFGCIEKPCNSSVPFKPSEESAVDWSSLSVSPNICELGMVVDSKKRDDHDDACGQAEARPSRTKVLHGATVQGQLSGYGESAKKRKGGDRGSSENLGNVSEGKCIKKPRASKLTNRSSSGHSTRLNFNHGTSEVQKSASLAVETSRDSRRLMQGARQLFLLAERRWH